MAARSYPYIEFSRLKDLCSIPLPSDLDEVTYIGNATNFRRGLLNQFGRDGLDVRKEIAEKEDVRLTYCGYSRFLESDLRQIFPLSQSHGNTRYKRNAKFLAREMITRGFVSVTRATITIICRRADSGFRHLQQQSKRISLIICGSRSTTPLVNTRFPSAYFLETAATRHPGTAPSQKRPMAP